MSSSSSPEIPPLAHQPGTLLMHLLNRCNLRCRHCYMDAALQGDTVLPLELALRSLGETERLGIRTVYLTGGEPTLYPALPALLAYTAGQETYNLVLSTNGTRIGPAEAAELRASNASANVSIDGEEAYHDRFRGAPGAFRAAGEGIAALVAAGVPVTVVVTICRDNLGSLKGLAAWALRMGVQKISVQPLHEVGRGAAIRRQKLSDEQMCDLFMITSDLGYQYRERGLRFSLNYRAKSFMLAHPCAAFVCDGATCHRKVTKEIKTLVIREDGTVLPEIPTLNPRYALGNLREGTLAELVARYFAGGSSTAAGNGTSGGYEDFRQLCRTAYAQTVPTYAAPIVPWDEIISARSWDLQEGPGEEDR